MSKDFTFEPAEWIPFRDKEVLQRVRNIKREDMEKHDNPDFRIKILLNPNAMMVSDMVLRMKESDDLNKRCVMIIPNPAPDVYQQVAELINRFQINCRNVHLFALDEWADEQGNIAPITYKAGFGYSFRKYLVSNIEPHLRMPEKNIHSPNNQNISSYSDIISDVGHGGADISYTGPGWAGHLGFIDPNTPEFASANLDEFMQLGSRVVSLHPLTIAQNSLHGCFGQSGDIANVPPKAATIGPLDIKRARNRMEIHALTTSGSFSSWQRMISRLVLYGPVTPQVPTSIIQLLPTTVYVSESIASPFGLVETEGY